jgi:two-component system, chemotaxis family, response regulator Rcp1
MSERAGDRRLRILLLEDNPGDVRLIEETLKQTPYSTELEVTRDGAETLGALRGRSPFGHEALPDLILLDLNTPGLDGRKVLAEVRSDPELNRIPVVIFTSSPGDEDVLMAFSFHADGFVRKPLEVKEFQELVRRLEVTA